MIRLKGMLAGKLAKIEGGCCVEGEKKELKSSLSFVIEDHTHKHVTKLHIEP